jgi:hypothetical protein
MEREMTGSVCINCSELLIEAGRGHIHLAPPSNYRCTWAHSGDGFACPAPTPEDEMAAAEANRQEGYDEGYADGEKRASLALRHEGYDEGYADARATYDTDDF